MTQNLVESTDPTLDDDNKSDSDDEYEYEEVIEEYEEEITEESDSEMPVKISEGSNSLEIRSKLSILTKYLKKKHIF